MIFHRVLVSPSIIISRVVGQDQNIILPLTGLQTSNLCKRAFIVHVDSFAYQKGKK